MGLQYARLKVVHGSRCINETVGQKVKGAYVRLPVGLGPMPNRK